MYYSLTLRGRSREWAVKIPENMVEGLREDGFEVDEIVNSTPMWVVDAGLVHPWCAIQDLFDLPSRIWRKIRGRT